MPTPHRCPRIGPTLPIVRHVMLTGTREDALENLPRLCPGERLECGAARMSLVGRTSRVDVRVIAETGIDEGRREAPLVLLALPFEGRTALEADRFVNRLRRHVCRIRVCH